MRDVARRAFALENRIDKVLAAAGVRTTEQLKITWPKLFDVFLPKLAQLNLPLPLGDSSDHFRTATLRDAGGWDPHNVIEDADLGMRLAHFGHRSSVIDSTTYEESRANVSHWLGQRSRWFKRWMQTWPVHMREPRKLFDALGLRGFMTFVIGGNALVALAHPVRTRLGAHAVNGRSSGFCPPTDLAGVVSGYFLGLGQRRMPDKAIELVVTPVHWLLLSVAAWCAAWELIFSPFRWRKTEHGLDKASRENERICAMLELERRLSDLERRGQLPEILG